MDSTYTLELLDMLLLVGIGGGLGFIITSLRFNRKRQSHNIDRDATDFPSAELPAVEPQSTAGKTSDAETIADLQEALRRCVARYDFVRSVADAVIVDQDNWSDFHHDEGRRLVYSHFHEWAVKNRRPGHEDLEDAICELAVSVHSAADAPEIDYDDPDPDEMLAAAAGEQYAIRRLRALSTQRWWPAQFERVLTAYWKAGYVPPRPASALRKSRDEGSNGNQDHGAEPPPAPSWKPGGGDPEPGSELPSGF